jgi:hypothetical protein
MMKKLLYILLTFFALASAQLTAETVKAALAGKLVIDTARNETVTSAFPENQALILDIDGDTRFLRGLEIELTAPQSALAKPPFFLTFYRDVKESGEASDEWEVKLVYTENLAGKISTVYQIPFRMNSGFRRTPYVTLLPEAMDGAAFPLLLRVTSTKALTDEIALFHLSVRPVSGDEGAVKLILRYPQLLRDRPVSVLIDDEVVDDITALQFLREGEHQLLVISEDYRTESRRFFVDRGKTTEISIMLKDTMPLLLFEAPDRALIFINNRRIVSTDAPYPIAPGIYDIKIQVSDYTIIKTVQIQKGKTYRVAFTMDMSVSEME